MSARLTLRSRRLRLAALLAVAVAASILALAASVPGAFEGLVYLLPPLALAATFALGRYPGERALVALAAGRARSGRRRGRARPAAPAPVARRCVPRGGLLIAASLAVRPPPLGACTQS